MRTQILDSGISIPAKKVQPPIQELNLYEVHQKRRMEAGFPKVVKVTVGEASYRLYIDGDDVYAESDDCAVSVELMAYYSMDCEPYRADWRRIEYEILC